jgi:hypothetical protein
MDLKKPLRVPREKVWAAQQRERDFFGDFVENTWETHFIDSRITSRKLIRREKIIIAAANYYFLGL